MSHRSYRNAVLARRKARRAFRRGTVLTARGLREHFATAECLIHITSRRALGPFTWLVAAPPGHTLSGISDGRLVFSSGRLRTTPAPWHPWVCVHGTPRARGTTLPTPKAARVLLRAAARGTPVLDLGQALTRAHQGDPQTRGICPTLPGDDPIQ